VYEFKLPDLGEGIHEGEILKWHVAVGETIAEDASLVDVETDKAAVTIPSPVAGTITSQSGGVGDVVKVGQVMVIIDNGSDIGVGQTTAGAVEVGTPTASAPAVAPHSETIAPVPAVVAPSGPRAGPVPAAPATRRLARELGVDIKMATPSGPAGRVTPEDVRRLAEGGVVTPAAAAADTGVAADEDHDNVAFAEFAAKGATAIPFLELEPLADFSREGPVEVEPLRSIRRKVARKLTTAMALIPHVAHMDEADVTDLETFRKREKERRRGGPGEKLTLLAFVMKAVAAGLKEAPSFNASLEPFKEEIIYKKYYNIGFAADTGRGLVVPVVPDADRKSIVQLADEIFEKATLARDGQLPAQEMRAGTFTITNIGLLGGTPLLPTINYPEVAILAMGQVQEKPVVRDGEIVIRKILPVTMAFDHRIADGADAARFLRKVVSRLSDPNLLLLET